MSQSEFTFSFAEHPECSGCGLPIAHEPMMHHSILGEWFLGHDFDCLLAAHEKALTRVLAGVPA